MELYTASQEALDMLFFVAFLSAFVVRKAVCVLVSENDRLGY